ncbi:MAG: hypothetical protein ACK4FV_06445 [Candidatus Nitrosocaldus sp.]
MMLIARVKGSGGYIHADLYEDEIGRARLAGELFIGALGKVDEDRIISYYCNSCSKELKGSPIIRSSDANEEVAEGHILLEEGEYACRECNSIIAKYKVFIKPSNIVSDATRRRSKSNYEAKGVMAEGKRGISLKRVIEEGVGVFYKGNRIGSIKDIVTIDGKEILLAVERDDGDGDGVDSGSDEQLLVPWEMVNGVGYDGINVKGRICSKCMYENSITDVYCTECGNKLQ